jgi:hypothetical protein
LHAQTQFNYGKDTQITARANLNRCARTASQSKQARPAVAAARY